MYGVDSIYIFSKKTSAFVDLVHIVGTSIEVPFRKQATGQLSTTSWGTRARMRHKQCGRIRNEEYMHGTLDRARLIPRTTTWVVTVALP